MTPEAQAVAQSMKDRAINVALVNGRIPCLWVSQAIAAGIQSLPLSEVTASPQATPDLEQLRHRIVAGCERIASLRIGVSRDDRQLATALAHYWQQAAATELLAVATFLNIARSAEEKEHGHEET